MKNKKYTCRAALLAAVIGFGMVNGTAVSTAMAGTISDTANTYNSQLYATASTAASSLENAKAYAALYEEALAYYKANKGQDNLWWMATDDSTISAAYTSAESYISSAESTTTVTTAYSTYAAADSTGSSLITRFNAANDNASIADPFTTGLLSTADITAADAAAASVSSIDEANVTDATAKAKLAVLRSMSGTKVQALIQKQQAAYQKVGAVVIGAGNAAGVINDAITSNVMTRTGQLRDGRVAQLAAKDKAVNQNIWLAVNGGRMDMDNGNGYGTTRVHFTNYQLGFDHQYDAKNYIGFYAGTTTGHLENPGTTYRTDIHDAMECGAYGTHKLPHGAYLDYILRYTEYQNEFLGQKFKLKDTGATIGYGLERKLRKATVNPYVKLVYDTIDMGDATLGANTVTSDTADNWSAKVGVDVHSAQGLTAGLAYRRGLSGGYTTLVDGIAVPKADYHAGVLSAHLDFDQPLSNRADLNLNFEKSYLDYNGWHVQGKFSYSF